MLRQEICVLSRGDHYSSQREICEICLFQNLNPFSLNAKIDIAKVKYPEAIGSSDEGNCFFVIDSKEKCVWKIARQTGDYHKFLDLQATQLPRIPTLSVDCNGHELLILTPRSLNIYRSFRPEGVAQKPLLTVQLPFDIEAPLHAVETSSGHFIILHSLKQDHVMFARYMPTMDRLFAVSKVTRDGRLVVRRFVPQNETQELSDPRYLALDSDDRVFVANGGTNRVTLLDSDLSWIRICCSTQYEDNGTIMPHRLCYDKVNRQLIVAGFFRRAGVNIYSIDRK